MGNINDNTRIKKLYKSGGSGQVAVKGGDGEVVVSKERITELNSLNDISELFNDDGLYQANKHLLRQVEDMRLDIEELHSFIKGAFGKDYTKASSQGATGNTGSTGPRGNAGTAGVKGSTGSQGSTGSAGAKGNTGSQGTQGSTGSQGNPGWGVSMQGQVSKSSDLPSSGNSDGDAYIVQFDDSIWVFTTVDGWMSGGSIQGPQGIKGNTGSQGPGGQKEIQVVKVLKDQQDQRVIQVELDQQEVKEYRD